MPRLPRTSELLVDEAQRLPYAQRWLLYRRASRLALATHRDLRRELERARWEVRTFEVGDLGVEVLTRILSRRLHWAGTRLSSAVEATALEAADLSRRYGGQLRRLFDDLYEAFQDTTIVNPWRHKENGSM